MHIQKTCIICVRQQPKCALWVVLQAAQGEVQALNGTVVEAFEAYRRQRPQLDELLAEARRHADAAARAPQELPPLPDGPSEV